MFEQIVVGLIAFGLALLPFFLLRRLLAPLVGRTTIFSYEAGLHYRNGRFVRMLEPGSYWYLQPRTTIMRIDLRPQRAVVSGQEVLSAEQVSVKVTLIVQFRISDPRQAIEGSDNFQQALYLAAQVALRNQVSLIAIDDLLANRAALDAAMLAQITPEAAALGLVVEAITIRDLSFSGELKRAFAQVVTAKKAGQAALEAARGESAALRNLANAARLLDNNPSLLYLRALRAANDDQQNRVVINLPPLAASASAELPAEG